MKEETKKRALYLDDVRTPTETLTGYHPWEIVRNYEEFVAWITQNGIPYLISFDHDLSKEHMDDYFNQVALVGYQFPDYDNYKEKTGMDCARWLGEYVQNNQAQLHLVSVHSHNPVGTTNIQSYINGLKKHMGWEQDCFITQYPYITESKKS